MGLGSGQHLNSKVSAEVARNPKLMIGNNGETVNEVG